MTRSQKKRALTLQQLLNLAKRKDEFVVLRSATDVLPGDYSAAMAPMLVDWNASKPEGPDGFGIIHNINHGGNPVEGTTALCSAKIPLNGVEAVEFLLVPLDKVGKEGLVQHGQLRFIFAEDQPIELLNLGDPEMGSVHHIHDLVLSWEAWRPPDAGYNVFTGMDPGSYLLTPRLFSGPQRFLEDALSQRDWFGHRLRLPGGPESFAELLKVSLVMADGVARHGISHLLKQGEDDWKDQAPSDDQASDQEKKEWEELRKMASPSPFTGVPLIDLSEKNQAYQTLLRSCATMALYTINVTVDRLVSRGLTDGLVMDKLMKPDLGQQEEWMDGLADAGLKGIFMRAPSAVKFLLKNPTGWPKTIPLYLEKAGLTRNEDGKSVVTQYSLHKETPYGPLSENLVT